MQNFACYCDGCNASDDHLWPELRRLDAAEISVWASFFLEQFNRRYRRDVQLCPDVIAGFMTHAWPGNIRELEEAVRQLVVGGGGDRLD
jgi:transcriptional regulator with PAS, ATPase and Fis domain